MNIAEIMARAEELPEEWVCGEHGWIMAYQPVNLTVICRVVLPKEKGYAAAFIANARQDVPALCDLVEQYRKTLEVIMHKAEQDVYDSTGADNHLIEIAAIAREALRENKQEPG